MKCESTIAWVQFIYLHLGTISLLVAAGSGLAHVAYCLIRRMDFTLNTTLAKIGAGFVLPAAFAMGFSALDPPSLLGCVTNLPLYILVGAVSVVWITLTVLFPKRRR
jgi:hypothetical protein